MITFISWAVVIGVAGYLGLGPDKISLAATRGAAGAVRGFRRARRGRTSKAAAGSPTGAQAGKAGPSSWRGALDGWREGIRAARDRRVAGADLWSIGSRFAGQAWGGGESMVAGARRMRADLAAWRARRRAAKGGPVVQGFVVDEQPASEASTSDNDDDQQVVQGVVVDPPNTENVDLDPFTVLDRDLEKFRQDHSLTWAEIQSTHGAPGRIWACFDCHDLILQHDPRLPYVPDDQGKGTFFWLRDDWNCQVCRKPDNGPYARAFPVRVDGGETGPCTAPSASPDATAAHSNEVHDSDRYELSDGPSSSFLTEPHKNEDGTHHVALSLMCQRCTQKLNEGEMPPNVASSGGSVGKSRWIPLDEGQEFFCPGCLKTYDASNYLEADPAHDLAAEPAESAPAEGAGALTPGTNNNQHKEIKTMNMQLTELTTVHELDSELEAIEGVLEETMAGLAKVDEWANLLPERWEATDYSTKGLDQAIAGIPESFSIKAEASTLLEQISVARKEIKAAQEFGEMADSVGATGNVNGFRAS